MNAPIGLFERLCQGAPHGQIVLDADQRVVFWNRWMERHSGTSESVADGRRLSEVFGLEALPPRLAASVRAALEEGCSAVLTRAFTPFPLPLFQVGAQRAPMVQGIHVQAVLLGDGNRYCLLDVRDESREARREALLREQTLELKRQAQELQRMNGELEARNAQLDEFVRHAGHDLKAPLRQLVTFSRLVQEDAGDEVSPQTLGDLAAIATVSARMSRTVDDLLVLARSARGELEREPVDLDTCLDLALENLLGSDPVDPPSIERSELPGVSGNPRLLTQLFQNLVGNALKFSDPPGRVRITCEEVEGERVFGVQDFGCGIAAEHLDSIFAPFRRLHVTSHVEGSGIGLSICARAVAWHGGRIWCESTPGEGAHFRFTLGEEAEAAAAA